MISFRMPYWFPCFLSTLIAFAVSIKPAMTLPTLPAESGLQNISPLLAIGAFTIMWVCFWCRVDMDIGEASRERTK